MKLIDSHAHLQFSQFDQDREEVIARTKAAGIGVINVGTDLETSRQAVALAEQNENMWATVGLHPTDSPAPDQLEKTFAELEKLARHGRVVGIGECGLDVRDEWQSEIKKKQIKIFERQIDLAKTVNKPLMIHCRGAYAEVLDIINNSELSGNVHFFAGDWPTAKKFLDLGFTLSFTGVVTFTNQYNEVIKKMPLERLLAETDCPFVAPCPWRGQRNEPIHVIEVIKQIAVLRHLTPETAAAATLANAHRLFAL